MADDTRKPQGITPDDDPYEYDWPDDARDLRAAEREELLRKEQIAPAPRVLTSFVIGVGTVLIFEVIASLIIDLRMILSLGIATVVCGIPALVIGLGLETLTRRLRQGFAAAIFFAAGAAIGFGWTYALVGVLFDRFADIPAEYAQDAQSLRVLVSWFMMTATATGFYLARVSTDHMRARPRAVYIAAGLIALVAVVGAVSLV